MTIIHNLGFPRIGAQRELKRAVEAYWKGDSSREQLLQTGKTLRARHWALQREKGLDLLPVGDFSWYDQMLDMSCTLGCVPARFGAVENEVDLDTYFRMARGQSSAGKAIAPCALTKWFDTNYHYLVPELTEAQTFRLASRKLFDELAEAQALGHAVKPVIIGPLTWLWLGKCRDGHFDKLQLLDRLLPVYGEILEALRRQGVEWVQLDEPILCLDLPHDWRGAFERVYNRLRSNGPKLLLATYFGALEENLGIVRGLPVDGLHVDAVRAPEQLIPLADWLPAHRILSAGIIDGRNVWRADLDCALDRLEPLHRRLGGRLWLAPSCSLLHVPLDLSLETELDAEVKSWLAFAVQKLDELATIKTALQESRAAAGPLLDASRIRLESKSRSPRVSNPAVRKQTAALDESLCRRHSGYLQRAKAQRQKLELPLFPTTTIGSFPQTGAIRAARSAYKKGELAKDQYENMVRQQIALTVAKQEEIGLDVLVHGEAERNDMVEYFAEHLTGFALTRSGWVQSYGSRCVKPPILFGDVARPEPITVPWIAYAQSLTSRPVKGMLTGPVTLVNWSFVRDDLPRSETCAQIALALRQEVLDLERAGISIIQIDEAALREGLPLRQKAWNAYLDWATRAFRIAAGGARDETQIHTHMCYSQFNDIIRSIAELDADVITIETSRSQMALLDAFENFRYPNEIGPGVYDIHSPNVPTPEQMVALIEAACRRIPADRLWVNPDCGLKTRDWPEVEAALRNMVGAARQLRGSHDII